MNLARLIEFLRHRLKAVTGTGIAMLGLVVALDVLFIPKADAHTAIERFPGFWAAFGFTGCVLIILLSKWYGHAGIMTREDYYDSAEDDKEQS